ncbi:MAG: phosphoribosylformylglycinamidine cyclo-ligase [Oligoflexia bacterium]|nr:phosphoribosylformylglycinamidine cyclo-ligase [Oligoflexia bacterium]
MTRPPDPAGQGTPSTDAYAQAGVDIAAGAAVVDGIKDAVRATYTPGVMGDLGGFGAMFSLQGRFSDPILVSGTDGVGTKLLVANRVGRHDTIGIDLVAMCVNDIITSGAQPLFFLDYFATGKLDPAIAVDVVKGIAEGCRRSGCALVGGETAEMPGMYGAGHYDLAGFAVGAVERRDLVDGSRIRADDVLVGIPSSGIHSNGYSLVRRLCDELDWDQTHGLGRPLGQILLEPTRIYVHDCRALLKRFDVRGMVHITGGGFTENIPRVLPKGLGAVLWKGSWQIQPIFHFLKERGGLTDAELYRTFNLGLGMIVIVPQDQADAAAAIVRGQVVGQVRADPTGQALVQG